MQRSGRPQLPCSTNYGSYPSYAIAEGTVVRIRRPGTKGWQSHKTKQELRFSKPIRSDEDGFSFCYDGWYIWVPRRLVNTGK